jgi:hypothetical protein
MRSYITGVDLGFGGGWIFPVRTMATIFSAHFLKTGEKHGSIFSRYFDSNSGLPDFSFYMIPKPEKMYQKNIKCTK